MFRNSLVHCVWDGAVRPACKIEERRFSALLSLFVPVQITLLTMDRSAGAASILSEDMAVLPSITLGDLLAEELDIEVPFGALIALREAGATTDLSEAVGRAVGELLISVADRGLIAMEQEDDVLLHTARRYSDFAGTPEARAQGLCTTAFRKGLSRALRSYWSIPHGALTLDTGCDAGMAAHLDLGRAEPHRVPTSTQSFSTWSRAIARAMVQGPHGRGRSIANGVQLS